VLVVVGNGAYLVLQRVDRGGAEERKENRSAEQRPRWFQGRPAPIIVAAVS